ncbi:hypothetical protein Tco_0983702 [Tanacetum coccineum]
MRITTHNAWGLPPSIEGNVTASKPETLEEATNIAQRLMDQILKHNSVQETNDHKRKFEDRRNIINNNYQNNCNNNNRSVHCITQDLALSGVRIVTK